MLLLETDYYNLIILDIQGLNLIESKYNCKIILFVFMISKLIIYNQKRYLGKIMFFNISIFNNVSY